jgi:hypothetical protein
MPLRLQKGQIWKNSKATFEILQLGSKIKTKVTKHKDPSNPEVLFMSPEQFKGMVKLHG